MDLKIQTKVNTKKASHSRQSIFRAFSSFRVFHFDLITNRSIWSKLFAHLLIATILMSFISSYLATEVKFKHTPTTCENPACYNNSDICPDAMICEPVPLPVFNFIDDICIYIFTVEYLIRLLCCWAVPPRYFRLPSLMVFCRLQLTKSMIRLYPISLLGIIPDEWPTDTPDPALKFSEVYLRFVFKFNNLIDLATILPYYAGLVSNKHVAGQPFLRSIRLLRIFKLIKRLELTKIMITTLFFCYRKAIHVIVVSVLMLLGIMIFLACLVYEVEKGTFQATVDYPHGEYLKPAFNGVGSQVSPYNSIPVAIYNAFYTLCLIGDDFAPSTWAGRMLSSMMMAIGLMALTIPVSIISVQVDMKLTQERNIRWELAAFALHITELRDDDFLFLFDLMDSNKNGTLSEEELKQCLAKAGINISIGWLTLLMEQEDCNHDGVVSREEFLAICYKLQGRTKEYNEQHAMLTDKFIRSQLDKDIEKYNEILFGADIKKPKKKAAILQRRESSMLWEQVSLGMHMDDKLVKVTELEMLAMFDIADTDNSGNLDENEVFQLLQQIGIAVTIQQLCGMLSEEDCDHDGLVSKDEFIGICYKLQHNTAAYESQHTLLKERYLADKLYHDADAAGVVPSDEILRATSSKDSFNEGCWVVTGSALHINSMTEADMLQVFRDADLDHSNSLDPNEVRALLGSLGVKNTVDAVIAILLDLDCDHDGLVSPDEFLAICYKMQGRVKEYNAQLKVLRKKFVSEKLLGLPPSSDDVDRVDRCGDDDAEANQCYDSSNVINTVNADAYSTGNRHSEADVMQSVVSKLLLQTGGILDILDMLEDSDEVEQTEAVAASEVSDFVDLDPAAQNTDTVITAAIVVQSDSTGVESPCDRSAVDDLGTDILAGSDLGVEKAATSHINKNADSIAYSQILEKLEVGGLDEDCSRLRESSAQGTQDKGCVAHPVTSDVERERKADASSFITGDELLKEEEQLPCADLAAVRTVAAGDFQSVDDATATSWLSQLTVLQRCSSDVWDFEGDASRELWNDNFGDA